MPKPKNIQQRIAIRNAAFELFQAKGFAAATYGEIAKASGISRSLVQSYFPKKTMIPDQIFLSISSAAQHAAEELGILQGDALDKLQVVGYLFFSYLLKDARMRTFTSSVLQEREATSNGLMYDEEWLVSLFDGCDYDKADFSRCYIMAMGSGYEYLYRCLSVGDEPDVEFLLTGVLKVFAVLTGLLDLGRLEASGVAGVASRCQAVLPDKELAEAFRLMDSYISKQ